jgi:hypothetical protein
MTHDNYTTKSSDADTHIRKVLFVLNAGFYALNANR